MILITLLIGFCLVSALITLGLGVFVYAKNSASPVNRHFLAVMLAATYWAIGEFLIWNSGTYDWFFFWLKASSLWPFAILLMFHFVLTFTSHPLARPEKAWILTLLLYIPASLFSLIGIFSNEMFLVKPTPMGFCYLPAPGSLLHLLVNIYIVILMVSAIAICFLAWRQAPRGKIRRQYRLVTVAVTTVVFFGALSAVLLPLYDLYIPNLVFIGIVLFTEIIVYTILRYGLFTLSPETAVPNLIRMMPDGLILADMDGRILTVNASAAGILNAPEKELPGRFVSRYLPEASCTALMQSLLDQGLVPDFEVHPDAAENRTLSISGSLVKDPDGEPAGVILILRDITDRKASEKALEIANEKVSLLTQLTRHDISNLVTGLDGYLLLLKERTDGKDDDAYISSCIEIVEKIGHQLQFTREYQDIGVHRPLWQPLAGIVERARGDLSHKDVTITPVFSAVEIYADPMIVKVFYNLLENAVRHGEHVTSITIRTAILPSHDLQIAVEDNGTGVQDHDKERIFRYGVGKNTGLGLALSRDILAVTGIRLIETGEWGKGARFELLVPASGWKSL